MTTIPVGFKYLLITEEYPDFTSVGSSFNDVAYLTMTTPAGRNHFSVMDVNEKHATFSPLIGATIGEYEAGWTGPEWREECIDVPVSSGSAQFKISVNNVSDFSLQSVILVDEIKFKPGSDGETCRD